MSNCLNCGKELENPKAKYCSGKCKMAARRSPKKVTTATKIKVGSSRHKPLKTETPTPLKNLELDTVVTIHTQPWIKKIEDYCNANNCSPDDLINAHKNFNKRPSLKDIMDNGKKESNSEKTTARGGIEYLKQRQRAKGIITKE